MPEIVSAYKNRPKIDDTLDKRFKYDCESNGVYEEVSKNSISKVFMKSDTINEAFIEEFNTKTAGLKAPSTFSIFVKKMGEYTDKIGNVIGETGKTMVNIGSSLDSTVASIPGVTYVTDTIKSSGQSISSSIKTNDTLSSGMSNVSSGMSNVSSGMSNVFDVLGKAASGLAPILKAVKVLGAG
jgi:hypothetical protein